MTPLNLRAVHPALYTIAMEAFKEGDAHRFVYTCQDRLCAVADNIQPLRQKGIYEQCLLAAYADTRTNYRKWSPCELEMLFHLADKSKLRDAGDAIPDQPVVQVFRGVAGRGVARRLRGVSWTLSLDVACWFATRYQLAHASVLTAEISNETILAYSAGRSEQEVFCYPKSFRRLKLSSVEIQERAAEQEKATRLCERIRMTNLFAARASGYGLAPGV